MGLSDDLELQPLLSGFFLSMYLVIMLGNVLIILALNSDYQVHTHMYFFLLSLADIGFISKTIPKMIVNIQTLSRVISCGVCLTQMSIFMFFGCIDDFLLTVMAYDPFEAICYPLHYLVTMKPCLYGLLVLSFFIRLLDSQLHYLIVSQLTCFMNVEIPHFFCDPSQLLNLACFELLTNNIFIYSIGAIFGSVLLLGIIFSYYNICSILRILLTDEKYKALSTCHSHMSFFCLFYGRALGVYLSSAVSPSPRQCVVALVMYTVITFIQFKKKNIKRATKKLLRNTI
ncbi:olfactory receptor 7E24-like [Saccopteryx bilineata]|uniref:olfactory receptor 7E24-like n=1 Tax=Saccopteryx bilineata TaxID=59482 RepID=UPI00338D71DA